MRDLGGASLVITGGSSGIGRAAAMAARRETVLREGWRVAGGPRRNGQW